MHPDRRWGAQTKGDCSPRLGGRVSETAVDNGGSGLLIPRHGPWRDTVTRRRGHPVEGRGLVGLRRPRPRLRRLLLFSRRSRGRGTRTSQSVVWDNFVEEGGGDIVRDLHIVEDHFVFLFLQRLDEDLASLSCLNEV